MATKSSNANPFANFYEAQTTATAEIAQAALNGMQRLQKLTLEAMRAGAGGQFSLAQSMASMRDGGDVSRSLSQAAAPAAEQGARYQREMVQAIAEMNNDIVRASYSMMERMRDALGTATQGSMAMTSALPGLPMGGESTANPMAMVDSAMRQCRQRCAEMEPGSRHGGGVSETASAALPRAQRRRESQSAQPTKTEFAPRLFFLLKQSCVAGTAAP